MSGGESDEQKDEQPQVVADPLPFHLGRYAISCAEITRSTVGKKRRREWSVYDAFDLGRETIE